MSMIPRSIPACAGEPSRSSAPCKQSRVYPRVCGGTMLRQPRSVLPKGLSPRVRGNPGLHLELVHCSGSIPACAGEPIPFFPDSAIVPVYPRVCGGTLDPLAEPRLHRRSIPACAGEPLPTPWSSRTSAVYPRVCGGTPAPRLKMIRQGGLSPRVRGNRLAGGSCFQCQGSIPACAGEPSKRR